MATKKVNKVSTGKILLIILLCTMGIYIGQQVFSYVNRKMRTEIVVEDTVYDFVRTEGIVIRNEVLVPETNKGIVVYNYGDGEEVSKTADIAQIYQREETARTKTQIDQLQKELDNLKKIDSANSSSFAGINVIENLSTQINNKVGQIVDIASTGLVGEIGEKKDELSVLLNRKKIAMGEEDTFVKRIAELEAQLQYLKSTIMENGAPVPTPSEGYFSKAVDGYESIFTFNSLPELTYDSFQALSKRTPLPMGNNLGKIVKTHVWYLGVTLENKDVEKFQVGDVVKLDFKFPNGQTIQAKVESILPSPSRKEAVLIFQCKDVSARILTLRKQSVDIIFSNHSGLRIGSKALYHENNIPGVYVLDKTTIRFKPVQIIKDNGKTILCQPDASADDDHRLRMLDSVIMESGGMDLKDGKQLNENTVEGVKSTDGTT